MTTMSRLLVLKGSEGIFANTGTGNTFFNSTCVRLFVTADAKISLLDADDNYIGNTSFKAAGTQEYFISKKQTDKIKVISGSVQGTPVGFAD